MNDSVEGSSAEVVMEGLALLLDVCGGQEEEIRRRRGQIERAIAEVGGQGYLGAAQLVGEYSALRPMEAMVRLYREKGPLNVGYMARELLKRGVRTKSADFANSLRSTLHRSLESTRPDSPKWDKREDGVWVLRDKVQAASEAD